MITIRTQIHNHAVALVSLFIAVSALAYNTWRNETTEEQRNVRHAAFRVLENLGDLQQVVDFRYYYLPFKQEGYREGELRIQGFGNASMIRDLMMLMPGPAPQAGTHLHELWVESFNLLNELTPDGRHTAAATDAEKKLTQAIAQSRDAVLQVLRELD